MKFVVTFVLLFVLAGVSVADYQIVATIDAPDTNISGLGFGNGSLWAVDGITGFAYQVNPATGAVQNSWYCATSGTRVPTGLTFAFNKVYIIMAQPANQDVPHCYMYDESGNYTDEFDLDC